MSKIRAGTCPSVRGILVERSGTEVRGPSVPGPHVIHGYVATNLYVCPMSQKPPCVSLVSRSLFVSSFRPVFHCYIPRPLVIYMYTYIHARTYIYTLYIYRREATNWVPLSSKWLPSPHRWAADINYKRSSRTQRSPRSRRRFFGFLRSGTLGKTSMDFEYVLDDIEWFTKSMRLKIGSLFFLIDMIDDSWHWI